MPTFRQAEACLAAIRLVKSHDATQPLTDTERETLNAFPGFGILALHIFPNPVTGNYPSTAWTSAGEELQSLLTPLEYASAKRSTFTAFYTSPVVMTALHHALERCGISDDACVLEPGCGILRFADAGHPQWDWTGVELDSISAQIARLLHPDATIHLGNFADATLSDGFDAVIGNVPFADLATRYEGQSYALHDAFLLKSLSHLRPGGVMAVVVSHYTLDKLDPSVRLALGQQADFLGTIRLPSTAFADEGTSVVADLLFLRKRESGTLARDIDESWITAEPWTLEDTTVPINRYFINNPRMVLGRFSRENRLYAASYSVLPTGDLAEQLSKAIRQLPEASRTNVRVRPLPQVPVIPQTPTFPVPPLEHLTEASFYLAPDGTIAQVTEGIGVPVVYGGQTLHAKVGKTGPRIAALILLRDAARSVLRTQNIGAPLNDRQRTRKRLNMIYDAFVDVYGPINHTNVSSRTDGTLVRSMPNLVKFREDPDAMLVMALEHYEEETDTATKSNIMRQDVVGTLPDVTRVSSASDALIASLNRYGEMQLSYMLELYPVTPETLLEELGTLVYEDPDDENGCWYTADVYLSGNVRQTLTRACLAADRPGGQKFLRNVEALQAVQPPDLLPGDIDTNLGAPWIPAPDVQAFATEIFRVANGAIRVAHLVKDALWSVVGDWSTTRLVSVNTDYGTERINGLLLLQQALNMQLPTIRDTITRADGTEERRVNADATLAAREKQQKIKDTFSTWLWQNQERSERLVRIYNDRYNHIRLRTFDGRHLTFPGMNPSITPYPHQKDAVWRIMSTRNTLLADPVGGGKSLEQIAAAMKLKQAGLMRRPLFIQPNHLLEQFGREFLHLYPNAKLLIADKDKCTKAHRKQLTARILSAEWDGILMTHEAFGLLSMSVPLQQQFLQQQIDEYETLLVSMVDTRDPSQRNLLKPIEKQKAAYEQRLEALGNPDRKDDGLVFDELGIDGLFADEAVAYKNMHTPTKMRNVAGIQTEGSQRAFDMAMKCDYLNATGRRIIFASGTPISNTMVEMYTLQRYLDPDGLADADLVHFDAWAATFGKIVESMEISPDGQTLRQRSRFARFVNLPELQQMFRSFANVPKGLNLPTPRLRGGKPQVVAVPMTARQHALQDRLVVRYEDLRTGRVKPPDDMAILITGDGRKLALDARLLSSDAAMDDHPKVEALVSEVVQTYHQTSATRGTQLIFCDLGVHPNRWGFSVYQAVRDGLIAQGIPPQEMSCIGEANTDAKKHQLFEQVRSGRVRVLLGSTQSMGTGMNVQQRLARLHHVDAPWKPSEIEQRDGRILRQGNRYFDEVDITRYVTEGSFDAFMWQALETKATFIAQLMSGSLAERQANDIDDHVLSYAEVKAIASGNPAFRVLAEMEAEIKRATVRRRSHADEQFLASKQLKILPDQIARTRLSLAALQGDSSVIPDAPDEDIVIEGVPYPTEAEALDGLGKILERVNWFAAQPTTVTLGTYQGFTWGIDLHPARVPEVSLTGQAHRTAMLARNMRGPRSILNATEHLYARLAIDTRLTEQRLSLAESQLIAYQSLQGQPFTGQDYLKTLIRLRDHLEDALSRRTEDRTETITQLITAFTTLTATQTGHQAAAPRQTGLKTAPMMESIITQISDREMTVDAEGQGLLFPDA